MQGNPRRSGAEFTSAPLAGNILAEPGADQYGQASTSRMGASVISVGEGQIARNEAIAKQRGERIFQGAPKFWKVTNRAQLGNVQVWMDVFNGEVFPENADREDKRTWLQPGDSMVVPLEAGLHFFGNVFDKRLVDAEAIIEKSGGFVLEGKKQQSDRSPARIIGGPIGLPDVIIEPIDGRMRLVGEPIALYEAYDRATRSKRMLRTNTDPDLLAEEKAILEQRLAEYRIDEVADAVLYDAKGNPVAAQSEVCPCSPIAHRRGIPGCAHSAATSKAVIIAPRAEDPEYEVEAEPSDDEPEPDQEQPQASRRGRGKG